MTCNRIHHANSLSAEIDHNFSQAHRIVTTSILPVVDQYAEHSKNLWEGSKVNLPYSCLATVHTHFLQFWKQFFEASANVSLSGYEEPPADEETIIEDATTATTPSTSTYGSPPLVHDSTLTPPSNGSDYTDGSFSTSPVQATPRLSSKQTKTPKQKPSAAPYSSPYESLRRDVLSTSQPSPSKATLPSTPRAQHTLPQHLREPQSSPFAPPSTNARTAHRAPANDALLHRVLDKKWRLQATPHSTRRLPYRYDPLHADKTPKPSTKKQGRFAIEDNAFDSSPEIAAPELHAEIFDSPARRRRVPGVSVLTPAKRRTEGKARGDVSVKNGEDMMKGKENLWDSDSDEDGVGAGMSPPKTIFVDVPPGRLVKTPGECLHNPS